jgi:hypothetical protein
VKRYGQSTSSTSVNNEDGEIALSFAGGAFHRVYGQPNTPIELYDGEGEFTVAEYQTSAAAPGTLELTNARLKHTVTATSDPRSDSTADEWIEIETPNGTRYLNAYE